MLFNKSKNVTYTQMAMFFDENFWSDNPDEDTCYKYIYLLSHMLARKREYFRTFEDYDYFARYCATLVFSRFYKKKLGGLKDGGSVLNYLKKSLNYFRIDFLEEYYREVVNPNVQDINTTDILYAMRDNIQLTHLSEVQGELTVEVLDVFRDVPNMILEELSHSSYRSNPVELRRIYLSCLISLIKSFTLSLRSLDIIKRREELNYKLDRDFIIKLFKYERDTSITLWNLKPSMYNYIAFLTTKIRKEISSQLGQLINSYMLSAETLDSIIDSAWDTSSNKDFGDEL